MRLRFLLSCLLGLLIAGNAHAESTPYARAIEQAVAAFNAKQYDVARAHFAEAHAARPSARTWRGLGAADYELGRWPEATEELTKALDDARSPLSGELRARTEAMLASARAALPPPVRVEPTPEVEPVPEPLPEVALESEPTPAQEPIREHKFGVLRGVGLASLVLGAAGVALATGYGVRSIREGDTRDKYCDARGACIDPRGVEAGEAAHRTGTIASVGWVLAGVGLAGAVALFWTDRARRRADRPSAELRLGPSSLALVGRL